MRTAPRPQYLPGADADRAVMMILALAAEVSRCASGSIPTSGWRPRPHQLAGRRRSRRTARPRSKRPGVDAALVIDRITRVLLEPEAQRRTGPSAHAG
jgi:hypothetical protein